MADSQVRRLRTHTSQRFPGRIVAEMPHHAKHPISILIDAQILVEEAG